MTALDYRIWKFKRTLPITLGRLVGVVGCIFLLAYWFLPAPKVEAEALTFTPTPEITIVQTPVSTQTKVPEPTLDPKIVSYLQRKGGRIDKAYATLIFNACGKSNHKTKTIIAIAVAESSLGTKGIAKGKDSNFFSWFLGGKGYDPSREQMAKDMCNAVSGPYKNIVNTSGGVSTKLATKYVRGNINAETPWDWIKNVANAYALR